MKGKKFKKCLALALGVMIGANLPVSVPLPFTVFDSYAYTGTAAVKATSLNVRSGAGTGYSSVGRLAAGTAITITGEQRGTDGNTWYKIQFAGPNGVTNTGYVSSLYVRIPVSYTPDSDFEAYLNSQGFPESYKDGLRQLHAQYPNWVFKAKKTGLDWNTVIENESVLSRNLVAAGSVSSWKSVADGAYNWDNSTWTGLDGSSWVAASPDIIRYYMDPRNFLDETYVFQFLAHQYDPNTQTREGLTSMVAGTFLSGSTTSTGTEGSDFSGGSQSGGPQSGGPGGGPGSNAGPGVSGGPGSSSGSSSAGSSGGSSKAPQAPGNSTYDDSQHGPGVSGAGNPAPSSGGGSGDVSLESPHASITPVERRLLGASVSLEAPGAGADSSGGPGVSGSGPSSIGGPSTSPPGSSPVSPGSSPSSPGSSSGGSEFYIDILMNAAAQSGVSPYVLAAMILQEQGTGGGTGLISGNYAGYEGYYNFFNVEAYQSGSMSPTQMGLRYASQSGSYGRPWNTVEKSILGGAMNYGDNYVKSGQNTFYLKKFNVQGSSPYKHQYMSNIQGAASEAAKLSKAYTDDMKKTALEFHIPVYDNMPDQACVAPTGDGSPNNKLSGLNVDGFSLTPTFDKDTLEYNLIVDSSVTNITVNAWAADSNAHVTGAGSMTLRNGTNDVTITVTAQNGTVRTYVIHVVQQAGGASSGSPQSAAQPGSGAGGSGPGGSSGPGESAGPGGSAASQGGAVSGGSPGSQDHSGVPGGGGTPGGSHVTIVQVQP